MYDNGLDFLTAYRVRIFARVVDVHNRILDHRLAHVRMDGMLMLVEYG